MIQNARLEIESSCDSQELSVSNSYFSTNLYFLGQFLA